MADIMLTIERWYDLQLSLYRENCRYEALHSEVLNSRNRYREAQCAVVEFPTTLSGLRDRFFRSGEKQKSLVKAEAVAKANMDWLAADLQRQKEKTAALRQEAETLPSWETLKTLALENPETRERFNQREKEFCHALLKPLLEETLEELEAYRNQLRGGNLDMIRSPEERYETETAHIVPAKESYTLLLRLQSAMEASGQTLKISAYFENPAGFVAAAAKHNQLDRVNAAISQVEAMHKRIARLQEETE